MKIKGQQMAHSISAIGYQAIFTFEESAKSIPAYGSLSDVPNPFWRLLVQLLNNFIHFYIPIQSTSGQSCWVLSKDVIRELKINASELSLNATQNCTVINMALKAARMYNDL